MRPFRSVILASLLSCAVAHPAPADVKGALWLLETNSSLERSYRETWRDFKIVKRTAVKAADGVADFNATATLSLESTPSGAVATIHDEHSGEPLGSCVTPCEHAVAPGRTYLLGMYKLGHIFDSVYVEDARDGEVHAINLGLNYMDLWEDIQDCRREWADSAKPDTPAQPCLRHPPRMPFNAERSGHCYVTFDVAKSGQPRNVSAEACTDDIFARPSEFAVQWWFFHPRTERGQALTQKGERAKIAFELTDENGIVIPE